MKILFICRKNCFSSDNNNKNQLFLHNAIIQGEELTKYGCHVEYFFIVGKGFLGYLKSIPKIKKFTSINRFDVIHAHYGFSAYAAFLAGCRPLVVSFMGSDIFKKIILYINRLFCLFFKGVVIVKTEKMKLELKNKNAIVLPNGVDVDIFKPLDKKESRRALNLPLDKKLILFAADPKRPEKNYELAKNAVQILNQWDILLFPVYDVSHDRMPYYLNSADVLILTSLWEGSVNIVKEALACNVKIVSTNVGDVEFNIKNVAGCYIASFDPQDFAEKIRLALLDKRQVNGRRRILELNLDSLSASKRLIKVYEAIQI